MVSAVATLCVRNESLHIRRCITDLIQDGVDVVLIDNESTDDTVFIAKQFLGHGLVKIETLRWKGYFSLSDALEIEHRLALGEEHDWVIHIDADEWLCSPVEGETLLNGIQRADDCGANCINFNEFVFIPREEEDFCGKDYTQFMLNYYFFSPSYPRLMRAWKREFAFDNRDYGGHCLSGDGLKLHNEDFLLRHYIALSDDHVREKYLTRRFSENELKKGWHNNRVIIDENNIKFPNVEGLKSLPRWCSKSFSTSNKKTKHYWEWDK